jgi:molybdopterin-biosynthesis enzyme MoeA-like protein
MNTESSGPLPPEQLSRSIKPAVVTVGDELLFGERSNENQTWLLQLLRERAHPAETAMVLPDSVADIGKWLKTLLSAGCFPILVSGGIGGTHDDCTREGIAVALGVALTRHEACFEILATKYGAQFTSGRQRMALLPPGCELIANPIGAPGFSISGIYAFPGFPDMLQPMATRVLDQLLPDDSEHRWLVREYRLPLSEGVIARDIETFATRHSEVRIGLYPHAQRFPHEVTLRLRCDPRHPELIAAFEALVAEIKCKHGVDA